MPRTRKKNKRAESNEPEEKARPADTDEDSVDDVDDDCHHMPLISAEEKEMMGPLRFEIGAEVACNMGEDWLEGRVLQHFYTEPSFPPGHCAAYQVKLHDGGIIFAPRDHDQFVGVPTAAKEAAWDAFFESALATGHMAQPEVDVLSDALAEAGSTDERRDLLDEHVQEACARALLLWVPSVQ